MKFRTLALLSFVAGCGAGVVKEERSEPSEGPQAGSTGAVVPEQRVASVFDGRTHKLVELGDDEVSPLRARGLGVDRLGLTASILERHKGALRMRAPAAELRALGEERDERGMTHAKYEQTVRGVPVLGATVVAHFEESGRVSSIDSYYRDNVGDIDVTPRLEGKDAAAVALREALALRETKNADDLTLHAPPRLVVYTEDGQAPILGWETAVRAVRGYPMHMRYVIDAKTGDVVHRLDNLMSVEATGIGVNGQTRKFEVTQNGNAYQMLDTLATRNPNGIRTYTAGNTQTLPGTMVQSNSLTTWGAAAVDAHFNAATTYDYFRKTFNRQGIDGRNAPIISTVNFGQNYDNAFWDGVQMAYGDGATLFKPLSAGIDVVAHELTHGITTSTSNLVYQNQPGALNESVSDIFCVFVEHSIAPDPVKNWQVGEAIAKQGGPLRDMKSPKLGQQPTHMNEYVRTTQDNGGVHINSGIPNNAMHLMTVGGTNEVSKIAVPFGIGFEKSAQLWYRSNTMYFTQNTDFAGAARATLTAAKDLGFTQNEQNIVECGWIAVGILTGPCKTITAPTTGTDGGAPGADGGASTGAPSGTPAGEPTSTGDTADEDGDDEGTSTSAGRRRRSSRSIESNELGCAASPVGPGAAGASGLFAMALVALAARIRRRR